MAINLDIVDFATGNSFGTMPLPKEIESSIESLDEERLLRRLHLFLHTSKKISFIKTANSKGISEISGTTRKPFKQKGTGRARQGSNRSPQFRGGACIFGPKPITARYKINKKERLGMKRDLLLFLIKLSRLKVIDGISESKKSKEAQQSISKHIPSPNSKVLILADGASELSDQSFLAFRNLRNVSIDTGYHFNIFRVSVSDSILTTKSALQKLLNI